MTYTWNSVYISQTGGIVKYRYLLGRTHPFIICSKIFKIIFKKVLTNYDGRFIFILVKNITEAEA